MADLVFAGGVVRVEPPPMPEVRATPPTAGPVVVLPVGGPRGLRGFDGTSLVLEHLQSEPATVWGPISHGLGRYPVAWSLFDSDGRECGEYVVQHLDRNTLRVSMDVATAGVFRFL